MFEGKPDVSVIIPAYNEEAVIGDVVRGAKRVLEQAGYEFELLVIDDGSSDGTVQEATEAGACVLRHPRNLGNGATIKSGIRSARGSIVVMMDGDGQHDPEDIPRLLAPFQDGYHMVVGARSTDSHRWHRLVANTIYNTLATYVTGIQVKDLTSGFRALPRTLARRLCYMLPNTFSYPTTLTIAIANGGYSLKYIDIKAAARVGRSKIKLLRDGTRFLMIITKIATLFNPLKVFLPIGLLVLVPGLLYALYKLVIGRSWTLPTALAVSAGLVIVMLGFVTQQIALLRVQHIDRVDEPETLYHQVVLASSERQVGTEKPSASPLRPEAHGQHPALAASPGDVMTREVQVVPGKMDS